MGKRRKRLDEVLVERGLAPSRSQAKALVMTGRVRHGTEVLDKAGREIPLDWELTIETPPKYVSRGGDKLAGYFEKFPWPLAGLPFLDVGASTGGFSDYLLQAGAASGTCVDVGHGQLHYKLQTDERIVNLERVNARHLVEVELPLPDYPLIVMDLSFISLKLVLPAVWTLLRPGGLLVALVKPQFEAGKAEADRFKGVITDDGIRERIRDDILAWVDREFPDSCLVGCCESPLAGATGNLEYLAGWKRQGPGQS